MQYGHMKRILTTTSTVFSVIAPHFALAQAPNFGYLYSLSNAVYALVEQLIPLLVAIALLSFIWGLVRFILASGDEDAKEVGKRRMVWGIITLFVIVSVWGIVGLLGEITGVQMTASVSSPSLPF